MWWERDAWREQVAPIPYEAGMGRVLVWACCVRRTFSATPAYSDGKRASGCSHVTLSTGRPLPAYSRRLVRVQATCSLCQACGMDAFRRQQQACVWNAGSGGWCVRLHGNRCDLIEITAPDGLRVQFVAMFRMHAACPLTRGRRDVRVRPRWHSRVTRSTALQV
jgi:hypothetical protein